MAMRSDVSRYGVVARAMHWASAAAILAMLGSGLALDNAAGQASAAGILRFHALTGLAVLALTLLRVLWWWLADRKPPAPAGTPAWQTGAARIVHLAFYAVIPPLAGSGVAMVALSGAVGIVLGGSGVMPDFEALVPRRPHEVFAWLLVVLLALHLAAALFHHFVLGDRVLARMGIGRA